MQEEIIRNCLNCGLSHFETVNEETKVYCRHKKEFVSPYAKCDGFQCEPKGRR